MASATGQEVKHKQQYSIILRFSTTGSGSTQASIIRPRRRLSGLLKLGVHFFETRLVEAILDYANEQNKVRNYFVDFLKYYHFISFILSLYVL